MTLKIGRMTLLERCTPRVSRSFGDHPETLINAVIGCHVQISPSCDLWMQGARFGSIVDAGIDGHGREVVAVRMNNPNVKRLQWFFPTDLTVSR